VLDAMRERARLQARCEACGRFAAYPQDFEADTVCLRCSDDPRPGVRRRRAENVERFKRSFLRDHGNEGGEDAR